MSKANSRLERVRAQTINLLGEQLTKLKEAFPEAVTEGKIDFEKLRATLGDEVDDRPERYSFNWAGKRDAKAILHQQRDAGRSRCQLNLIWIAVELNVTAEL